MVQLVGAQQKDVERFSSRFQSGSLVIVDLVTRSEILDDRCPDKLLVVRQRCSPPWGPALTSELANWTCSSRTVDLSRSWI